MASLLLSGGAGASGCVIIKGKHLPEFSICRDCVLVSRRASEKKRSSGARGKRAVMPDGLGKNRFTAIGAHNESPLEKNRITGRTLLLTENHLVFKSISMFG